MMKALALLGVLALAPMPHIVALGDSITRGAFASTNYAAILGAQNEGVDGADSARIAREPMNGSVVIINAGTNDLWPIARDRRQLQPRLEAWDALVARAKGRRIIIVTVREIPSTPYFPGLDTLEASRTWSAHQRAVARRIGAGLVDLRGADPADYPDGVHPNARGQARIAGAISNVLTRIHR